MFHNKTTSDRSKRGELDFVTSECDAYFNFCQSFESREVPVDVYEMKMLGFATCE